MKDFQTIQEIPKPETEKYSTSRFLPSYLNRNLVIFYVGESGLYAVSKADICLF
jgi:hypothetical protein